MWTNDYFTMKALQIGKDIRYIHTPSLTNYIICHIEKNMMNLYLFLDSLIASCFSLIIRKGMYSGNDQLTCTQSML